MKDFERRDPLGQTLHFSDSTHSSQFSNCDETTSDFRSCEKEVVDWMREVATYERLGGKLYLLAVSYFYRFLSKTSLEKRQLQLLAASCLLLSSKIGSSHKPLSIQQLLECTDFNLNRRDLIVVVAGSSQSQCRQTKELPTPDAAAAADICSSVKAVYICPALEIIRTDK